MTQIVIRVPWTPPICIMSCFWLCPSPKEDITGERALSSFSHRTLGVGSPGSSFLNTHPFFFFSRLVSSSLAPHAVSSHCLCALCAPSLVRWLFSSRCPSSSIFLPSRSRTVWISLVHVHASVFFPRVSLALPSFPGNQLILCVSKPLCLRSSSLCFRFIQQGD